MPCPQLIRYRTIPCDPRQAGVDILALSYRDLHASQQHGMLVNDSPIVAVMQGKRLQLLTSNDEDFERVPGIAAGKSAHGPALRREVHPARPDTTPRPSRSATGGRPRPRAGRLTLPLFMKWTT